MQRHLPGKLLVLLTLLPACGDDKGDGSGSTGGSTGNATPATPEGTAAGASSPPTVISMYSSSSTASPAASSAGCQQRFFTRAWFAATTPWISPAESWPSDGSTVVLVGVATGGGTTETTASGFVNTVASAADMVQIPAGTYTLGVDKPEPNGAETQTLSKDLGAYYVDLYEVSNEEYNQFVIDKQAPPPASWPGGRFPGDDMAKNFLRARANSIEGGTTEVMKNILGERVLGLPGDLRADAGMPWKEIPRG